MEKNYYPLRQGKNGDTIVSDIPTRTYEKAEEYAADVEYYGGYLVCESCPPSIAKQLIEAYNEKHGPSQRHPLIVVYGEPASSRYPIVQASDLLDDPNDFSQDAAMKAMEKVNSMLEKNGLVVVFKKSPVRGHIGQELMKKAHVYFYIDNSAHSFTEGMDLGRTNSTDELLETKVPEDDSSIDDQIKFMNDILKLSRVNYTRIDGRIQASGQKSEDIPYSKHEKIYKSIINNLQAIKRFNNSPALHNVDVEKVIKDLLELVGCFVQTGSFNKADKESACENAEAALGMLLAFKKERETRRYGHIGEPLTGTGESFKMPIKHGKLQKILTKEQREYLVTEISANLPFYKDINVQFAEAIIFAVDEIDKLKNV